MTKRVTINIYSEAFRKLGYKVDAVTDAREALRIFQNHPDKYDLVITDQIMPEMTGIGTC